MTIVSELSRSFKVQWHSKRKRKRGDKDKHVWCFEIRRCQDYGIGMFAVQNISCGSVIIEAEDPIISTHRLPPSAASSKLSADKLFCHFCDTPLSNLKNHILRTVINSSGLPYLDQSCGPQFTRKNQLVECNDCQQVTWCSNECAAIGKLRHQFLCRRRHEKGKLTPKISPPRDVAHICPLESFYDTVDNPTIFQLAVDAMATILASVWKESYRHQFNSQQQQH